MKGCATGAMPAGGRHRNQSVRWGVGDTCASPADDVQVVLRTPAALGGRNPSAPITRTSVRSTVRGRSGSGTRAPVSGRCGYVLVWFVLLLVAIMGLAALTIDLGLVRAAQRQMQSAADSAALESLWGRDDPRVPGHLRDRWRREQASGAVSLQFDDDLDPMADALQLGAGPMLPMSASSAGDPSLDASRLLLVEDAGPYKPTVQTNWPDNEPHGDMVAGAFVGGETSFETAEYERADFVPASGGDPVLQGGPAMLVRLRRTNDFLGLDRQAGVSDAGPPLPLLFGRGGLVPARDPGAGYSLRHHGFTVRATAIAELRPAMSVGVLSAPDIPGAAPFAIRAERWDGLESGAASTLLLQVSESGAADVDGFTYLPQAAAVEGVLTFGMLLEAAAGSSVDAGTEVYVPLVVRADTGGVAAWWVVAFGLARVEIWQPSTETVLVSLIKEPEGRRAAYANASGLLLRPLVGAVVARAELFEELWGRRGAVQSALLTPVLVR